MRGALSLMVDLEAIKQYSFAGQWQGYLEQNCFFFTSAFHFFQISAYVAD